MFKHSHSSWLQTMASSPEAIHFKFVPISSLLTGIPGSGYLSHAINLYLRCKFFSLRLNHNVFLRSSKIKTYLRSHHFI